MGRRLVLGAAMALGVLRVGVACSSFGSNSEEQQQGDSGSADATSGSDAPFVPDSDGGSATWVPCAQRDLDAAHFCDDFDHAGRVDFGWRVVAPVGGGTIGESADALSAPRALVSRAPAGTGVGAAPLRFDRPDLVTVKARSKITLTFWLRVDAAPYPAQAKGNYTHVAVLFLDPPPCTTSGTTKQRQVELSFKDDGSLAAAVKGLGVACADGGEDYVTISTPLRLDDFNDGGAPPGFRRITMSLSRTSCTQGDGPSVTLDVEGAPPQCRALGLDPLEYGDIDFYAQIGVFAGGAHADTSFAYDNVTLDFD